MISRNRLIETLRTGTLALTATNRLARQIVADYDQAMIDAGLTAWRRPPVQTLEAWHADAAAKLYGGDARLLSQQQASCVWEEIVRDDLQMQQHDLLLVQPTVKKARQAYRLLCDYGATFDPSVSSEDQRAYWRWHQAWVQRLQEKGWLDPATTLRLVVDAIEAGTLAVDDTILLLGFDDFTPLQRRLIAALARAGCAVETIDLLPVSDPEVAAVVPSLDMRDEAGRCARWLRRVLTERPAARIGVVAPNLEQYRTLIVDEFTAELDPADRLTGGEKPLPFNISLGTPLAGEGLVFAALKLLRLPAVMSSDELSWLLRSPQVASSSSLAALRGRIDMELRKLRIAQLPYRKSRNILTGLGCDDELLRLLDILDRFRRDNRERRHGEWADVFARTLDNCGWPGERPVTSREYQVIASFREALSQLASLDVVSGRVGRQAALSSLGRLCREAIFQPESHGSQVQVLGLLESGGLRFDDLWIFGMHAGAIPQPLRPNPFIPLAVQRQAGMPHADAARELDYSRRQVERLRHSAPRVMFSWPLTVDGKECLPAVFLDGLPESAHHDSETASPAAEIFRNAPCLETLTDCRAEPLLSRKPVSGGTGIIKDQALCPFRAFAHHRLGARGIETPDIGLDNLTRGTLVHNLLEFFWADVRSFARLASMADDELTRQLEAAAEKAIRRIECSNRSDMPARTRALEVRRLVAQGRKWLAVERRRAPFEVVELEQLHEETIGRLHFRTRIDRIDRLADGRLAVIDYKTGLPDPRQWFAQRISEPQLPIYCQGLDNVDIGAVLFAVVRNRAADCRFAGVARTADDFPGVSDRTLQERLAESGWETIDHVLDNWRKILPELGNAFVAGHADVDPADPPATCQQCDLPSLCRIHEADFWPAREAEDD